MAFSHYKVANHKSPKALESDFSQEKVPQKIIEKRKRIYVKVDGGSERNMG